MLETTDRRSEKSMTIPVLTREGRLLEQATKGMNEGQGPCQGE